MIIRHFLRATAALRLAALALFMAPALTACDSIAMLSGPTEEFVLQADLAALGKDADTEAEIAETMQTSIAVIERRLSQTGVYIHEIADAGDGRLVLKLSGDDPKAALEAMLAYRGKLEFRMADMNALPDMVEQGIAPVGSEILPMRDNAYPPIAVRRKVAVDGSRIIDARQGVDPYTGQPVINIQFDEEGGKQLAETTRRHVGEAMAIVLDDVIVMSPFINEPIVGASMQLHGGFDEQEAFGLAVVLRSGALPASFAITGQSKLN